MPGKRPRDRKTHRYKGRRRVLGGGSRTRKVQRGGVWNPFASSSTASTGPARDKTGQTIVIGRTYTCSQIPTDIELKVTGITGQKVVGTDVDGRTQRTNISANKCTPLNTAGAIDKNQRPIVIGSRYICKGYTGFQEFTASGIGGKPGKFEVVGFDAKNKRRNFPARDCMLIPTGGITGTNSKNMRIAVGDRVSCDGATGDDTFVVSQITGFPGRDATVKGMDFKKKPHSYSASKCTKIGADEQIIGKSGDAPPQDIRIGAQVTCTGATGTRNLTVFAVTGFSGPNATVYGKTDQGKEHNFAAKQCKMTAAGGVTGIGRDDLPITRQSTVTCKTTLKGTKTFKVNRITGLAGKRATVEGPDIQNASTRSYTAGDCTQYVAEDQMFGLDRSPQKKRILKGARVTCKGVGSSKTFKVDRVTGQAGATAQILGPGGNPKYVANQCLLEDGGAAAIIGTGIDNSELREGDKVSCKGTLGAKTFVIQTITGVSGQRAAIRGMGNETYTAGQCSKFSESGEVFGLDKTTMNKRIEAPKPGPDGKEVRTKVRCKGFGGQKTFFVDRVTGISGKRAIVMGTGGAPKYTANECEVVDPSETIVANDSKGMSFVEGDTVTCTSGIGPMRRVKTFTVATISGRPGTGAAVRGTGNESYTARQCEAKSKTAVGEISFANTSAAADIAAKLKSTPGVRKVTIYGPGGQIIGQMGGGGSRKAGGQHRRGASRKQRGGQAPMPTGYKIVVEGITTAPDIPTMIQQAGLAGTVRIVPPAIPVGAAATGDAPPGSSAGSQQVAAATSAAASEGVPVDPGTGPAVYDNSFAPGGMNMGAAENMGYPENTGAAENMGYAEMNTGAADNAAAPIPRGVPPPSVPSRGIGPNMGNRGAPSNFGAPGANIAGPSRGVNNLQNVTPIAKPDGVAFAIEPGDYKGLLSKNKYFIYYDPFFQKRAANVIIKTGTDKKSGPQFGFYRVTGTDQQILDGIRAIRGMGTGNVFDDLIKDIERQITDEEGDLSNLKASLETARESAQVSGTTNSQRASIRERFRSLQEQITYKERTLRELDKALNIFKGEKAAEVTKSASASY